jgi:hypothetical protein
LLDIGFAVVVSPVPVSCALTPSASANPAAAAMIPIILLRSIIAFSSPVLIFGKVETALHIAFGTPAQTPL